MWIASRSADFPPYLERFIAAVVAVLLAAASSPVRADESDGFFSGFSRHLDRGGRIAHYRADISKASGTHVISGDCMSACTLWLSYKHSCVEPQESPHFEYGLFRGFFALTGGERRALSRLEQ